MRKGSFVFDYHFLIIGIGIQNTFEEGTKDFFSGVETGYEIKRGSNPNVHQASTFSLHFSLTIITIETMVGKGRFLWVKVGPQVTVRRE